MRFKRLVKPLSRILRSPSPAAAAATSSDIAAPSSDIAAATSSDAAHASRLEAARSLPDEEILRQLAALGVDPQSLARLVLEGAPSRLRQLAAQRIDDPAVLNALLKQMRNKDKSVYRIIKHKCDDLRAQERSEARIDSDAEAACASLERHAHRVHDPIYEPTFRHFHARWLALEDRAAPEIQDRARFAIDRCRDIMAAHARRRAEQQAETSRQAALQAAREQTAARDVEESRRQMEIAAAAAAQAQQMRESGEKARADAHAREAHALRRIAGLAASARKALRDGHTGQAAGLCRAIEEKRAQVSALPGHLAAQLHELDARLNELKQWKDYAVAPKRAELIAEMEALLSSSEAPVALAERIRQLKQDWSTISKGVVSESGADWQRFHQASVAAYRPCREYFEAQSRLRQENLQMRRSLLERLRAFEAGQAGDHPDWRLVAKVVREARREWRRAAPVDRAQGRAVEKEFTASMGRLQGRLDAWYERNAEEKRSLIERARHLGAGMDSRDAADEVKALQRRWKETGGVPQELERALWHEFREQCDAIYQKRLHAQAERIAGLEANRARAVALCQEVEHAADLEGAAPSDETARISQWRAAFDALGELPRVDQRGIQDRFERGLELCQSRAVQQRAREHEAAFGTLLEAARRIQDYGWAVAQDATPVDREALKQAAESFIAGVRQWPKGAAAALTQAWAKAEAAAGLDMAAQERALRMLCVRSEILTDCPTPAEDQAMRRDYQVRRLAERMRWDGAAHADELDALAMEWVRAGPIAAHLQAPLLARFARCRSGAR